MIIQESNLTLEYENWWITFKTLDRSFISDFNGVIPFDTTSRKDRSEEELTEIANIANTKTLKPDNRMHNLKWYLYSFTN